MIKEEEDWTEHREQWTDLTQARASEVALGGGWSMTPFLGPLPVSLARIRIWQVKTAVSATPPPENTFAQIGGFSWARCSVSPAENSPLPGRATAAS
jgi:hypothetical protein